MFGQSNERYTEFEKAAVLTRLTKNRNGHRDKVLKAQEVYQQKVIEELETRLDQAKNGQPVDPSFLGRFPIPEDYTKEYDRVIDRIQSQLGSTVLLTDHEFNQYMRDEWDWQNRFVASSAAYLAG